MQDFVLLWQNKLNLWNTSILIKGLMPPLYILWYVYSEADSFNTKWPTLSHTEMHFRENNIAV